MKRQRTLRLNKETLRRITATQLANVGGRDGVYDATQTCEPCVVDPLPSAATFTIENYQCVCRVLSNDPRKC